MKFVIQRVTHASVAIEDLVHGQIQKGFMANLNVVIGVLKGLVFLLIAGLPTIIPIGVIATIVVYIIKKKRKHITKEDV